MENCLFRFRFHQILQPWLPTEKIIDLNVLQIWQEGIAMLDSTL